MRTTGTRDIQKRTRCPLPTALHAGGYAFYGNSERLDVKQYVAPQTVIDMVDGAGGAHRVTY